VSRIHREEDAQRLLADALPGRVPRVLFSAREDYLYVMEHAHPDARPWKGLLLKGKIDTGIAVDAGLLLRDMHALTVPASFSERTIFRQLRTDPFYHRIQEVHPDLTPAIAPLIDSLETSTLALCHGDFSPKNLLVDPGLMLVDHETAHLGEPAMDIGFFTSHLILKAVRAPDRAADFTALVEAFLASYADDAVIRRALPHLGVCLLARVDGTSPVDYLLDDSQKGAARSLGRIILRGGVAGWAGVLARVRALSC
jgi:5-methylthioribose kinase